MVLPSGSGQSLSCFRVAKDEDKCLSDFSASVQWELSHYCWVAASQIPCLSWGTLGVIVNLATNIFYTTKIFSRLALPCLKIYWNLSCWVFHFLCRNSDSRCWWYKWKFWPGWELKRMDGNDPYGSSKAAIALGSICEPVHLTLYFLGWVSQAMLESLELSALSFKAVAFGTHVNTHQRSCSVWG